MMIQIYYDSLIGQNIGCYPILLVVKIMMKLLELQKMVDKERINSQEKAKLMHKKLAALEHQDGVTSAIRENRIKVAVQ